jgi:hypothetical protein
MVHNQAHPQAAIAVTASAAGCLDCLEQSLEHQNALNQSNPALRKSTDSEQGSDQTPPIEEGGARHW